MCITRLFVVAMILAIPVRARADDSTVVHGAVGEALDRAVQGSTGGGFWGAVLVAVEGEVILAKGYGFADYGSRPNTPRTIFEIASASKSFTAAAVLRLQMEGKLRVQDPIARFFPDVPDDKRDITVHQLLTHTSGISPQVGLPYASRVTREEFVRYVLESPLVSQPGERFAYCNVAYALLAALVEIVSGQPFEAYSKEHLFRRAGLIDTGFIQDEALEADRITTRLPQRTPEATARDWHWGWGYRGMGGVITTAYDLLRWDRALRGNEVLDEPAKDIYYKPILEGYACGWRVGTTSKGTTKVEHPGGVEGYAVNYVRHLDDDVVIVILSNGKTDIHALTKIIEDTLFPPPRMSVSVDAAPYELNQYRAAMFPGTAVWRVEKAEGNVVLTLEVGPRQHAAATIRLPLGTARKLRAALAAILATKRAGGAGDEQRMDAGVYLYPYAPQEQVQISEGLEITVMPRYVGRDEQRNRIVDERVTLVVMHTPRRHWPVMAKMDFESAKMLLEDLTTLLESFDRPVSPSPPR